MDRAAAGTSDSSFPPFAATPSRIYFPSSIQRPSYPVAIGVPCGPSATRINRRLSPPCIMSVESAPDVPMQSPSVAGEGSDEEGPKYGGFKRFEIELEVLSPLGSLFAMTAAAL